MEANVMVQANVAPTNLNVGRTAERPQSPERARPEPASPAPAQSPAVPALSAAEIAAVLSVNILNAHHSISPSTAEALITSEYPVPVNGRDITDSAIARYISSVNEMLGPSNFRLNFGIHEATEMITVQVIDTETDEVIREIPPESRLDTMARIQEFVGLLFDQSS